MSFSVHDEWQIAEKFHFVCWFLYGFAAWTLQIVDSWQDDCIDIIYQKPLQQCWLLCLVARLTSQMAPATPKSAMILTVNNWDFKRGLVTLNSRLNLSITKWMSCWKKANKLQFERFCHLQCLKSQMFQAEKENIFTGFF